MTRSDRVSVTVAQSRLAMIWLAGGGVIFLLMLAQTVSGKYGGQTTRAWGWFIPIIVPTLSLIVSAIAYSAATRPADGQEEQTVQTRAYRITFGLSCFYLIVVLSTLLLEPLSGQSPLEFITQSNLWIGPLQGLVGIALGAFFTSKK
jgi:hypothetical protein